LVKSGINLFLAGEHRNTKYALEKHKKCCCRADRGERFSAQTEAAKEIDHYGLRKKRKLSWDRVSPAVRGYSA
jgi:hypothetical protein